jgi:hypothetical protein
MKATRIFPSTPSCASGGIGAEQKTNVHMYQSNLDEKKPGLPADNAWRVPPPLRHVTTSPCSPTAYEYK